MHSPHANAWREIVERIAFDGRVWRPRSDGMGARRAGAEQSKPKQKSSPIK